MQDCLGIFNGDFSSCAHTLTKRVLELQQWSNQKRDERCGFPCVSQLKGGFYKWRWMWEGKFQCATKAPGIVGVAKKYSKDGAIEWAAVDFLKKAVAAGHIQPGDTNCEQTNN